MNISVRANFSKAEGVSHLCQQHISTAPRKTAKITWPIACYQLAETVYSVDSIEFHSKLLCLTIIGDVCFVIQIYKSCRKLALYHVRLGVFLAHDSIICRARNRLSPPARPSVGLSITRAGLRYCGALSTWQSTGCSKKTVPLFYFCDNFRKWTPILTIFSP